MRPFTSDCQWVDVTDVPAGDYSLRVSLNTEHLLSESSYDSNVATVKVTIPAADDPPSLRHPSNSASAK